ncbi:MAG TPA: carboxypeptidase-like regulatory domain-containing protein, partial [Terriglobia bacterium]|nr:carboxypeptidase-like regulatory domain-containing protein [Terriglobia bacterium]
MKTFLFVVALCAASAAAAQLPAGSISGQISSREGQPASGVRVSAMAVPDPALPTNSATALVSIGMTDNTGRYRLENVPPGLYYVVAGLVDLPTYYPGVSSTTGAKVVNVFSGTPIPDINFALVVPPGVTISGRAVQPTGGPAVGVQRVQLLGGVGLSQSSTLGPDGSFEFSRVRPGNYQLVVYTVATSVPTPITVTDRDITGIEVQVVPTVVVSGTINVANNGLRPRINLIFSPLKGLAGNVPNAVMQQNGTFRVVLPEAEYRIAWTQLPAGYQIESITAGTLDLLATTLKLAAGSPVPPIAVNLGIDGKVPWVKAGGRVSGLPVSQTGTPFRLVLLGGNTPEALDVPINPDGSFEFARILPGSYSGRITPPLPMPVITFVVPNRDTTDFKISIPPLKEVQAVITGGLGNVLPRLMLTLDAGTGGGTTSLSPPPQPGSRFNAFIPEGERRLTLNVPGYSIQSATYGSTNVLRDPVKISSSDTSELRIVVAPMNPVVAPAVGGVVGGVAGGIGGGAVLGGIFVPPPPSQIPP